MMEDTADAVVIGGGPAGLMAAEVIAKGGAKVIVCDGKPSLGRKFLMAGKSGLNLTKREEAAAFRGAYGDGFLSLERALAGFGPDEVVAWAEDLGQEMFTGSTGRVFPVAMKASPLLRAWLARLGGAGAELRTRWRWTGWQADCACIETPGGPVLVRARVTVLAMGGASWARLGSDGAWAAQFADQVADFAPANMGFEVDWSPHMAKHFGAPVKGVALLAGHEVGRGEFVISDRGLEGGGIYAVSRALREGAPLALDLLPDLSVDEVRQRLSRTRMKESLANRLRKGLGLSPVKIALVQEFGRPVPQDLAPLLKGLPVPLKGPRPMDEAISTAGGLRFDALTSDLMLKDRPGVFACGEMLDWEAPTGGYLLTACLATGRLAGEAAVRYAS